MVLDSRKASWVNLKIIVSSFREISAVESATDMIMEEVTVIEDSDEEEDDDNGKSDMELDRDDAA